jgi:tetratricopeptide (TPR) repeat protein
VNAERGNLIAACRAAIGRGDARAAAPLLVAVRAAIERTGPYSLIAELAQAALPLAREVGGPPLAEVLWVLGTCEGWSGETFSAHERLLEAVARSEGGPDPKLPSRIRLALATSLLNLGRSAEAAQLAESALPVLAGGPGEALAHWVLGASARYLGRMSEAHASFSSAVEAARRGGERGMENRALAAVAIVLHGVGRTDEGREGYQRALELARERADRSLEAQTLGNLGALLQEEGEVEEAERCYQEAIRLYRALGNRREVANILGNVGNLELAEGRLVEAEARYAEALRAHREIGNRREEGIVVGNLARLWARRGDLARAEALLLEAVAVHREVRNQRFLGIALTHLGELHLPVAPDLAKIELAEAVELHRTVGGPRALGWSLGALARAHLALGDEAAAGSAAEEALERLRAGHGKDFAAEILSAVAEVVSALGQPERSRELLAELEGPFGESVRRDAGSTGG